MHTIYSSGLGIIEVKSFVGLKVVETWSCLVETELNKCECKSELFYPKGMYGLCVCVRTCGSFYKVLSKQWKVQ